MNFKYKVRGKIVKISATWYHIHSNRKCKTNYRLINVCPLMMRSAYHGGLMIMLTNCWKRNVHFFETNGNLITDGVNIKIIVSTSKENYMSSKTCDEHLQ